MLLKEGGVMEGIYNKSLIHFNSKTMAFKTKDSNDSLYYIKAKRVKRMDD